MRARLGLVPWKAMKLTNFGNRVCRERTQSMTLRGG